MFSKLFGLGRKNRSAQHPKTHVSRAARPRSFRPLLEELEVRCTPSVSVYPAPEFHVVCSGGPDTVTVDHSGSYTLINGVHYDDGPIITITIIGGTGGLTTNIRATARPVYVEGHHDLDAVNIGDLSNKVQGIHESVYVTNPPWYNTINVNNQGDSAARTGTINTATINGTLYERISGLGMWGDLNCKAADTTAVNLRTGSGGTSTNVLATALLAHGGATTIYGNHGHDTVNVGNVGSVQNIAGPLTIENDPDYTAIYIYDHLDSGNRTVTLDNFTPSRDSEFGRIQGLSPAPISFECADVGDVNIYTGTGTEVVNVLSASPFGGALTLLGHSTNTTVNVGDSGSVQDIRGNLIIQNPLSYTVVNVDDSNDSTGRTAYLGIASFGGQSYGAISGLAPGYIFYKLQNTARVTITGGTGGNVFQIEALGTQFYANVPVTINGGSGANIFRIGQGAGLLANIYGTLNLHGSGSDILEFFDQNHSGPETYTFDNIPSNLTLATDPAFNCNFTGMASVYLETNLDPGNVINDASSSVFVDVPAP